MFVGMVDVDVPYLALSYACATGIIASSLALRRDERLLSLLDSCFPTSLTERVVDEGRSRISVSDLLIGAYSAFGGSGSFLKAWNLCRIGIFRSATLMLYRAFSNALPANSRDE